MNEEENNRVIAEIREDYLHAAIEKALEEDCYSIDAIIRAQFQKAMDTLMNMHQGDTQKAIKAYRNGYSMIADYYNAD